MLPNLRLLIAAMLATVVALTCGFGVFAAFHVSYDPIAHLPAAAAPLQLAADAQVTPSLFAARESADQHSQFDVPFAASQETAPASSAAEQRAAAEPAADEAPATASPGAADEAALSAARDPAREVEATTPPEQPAATSPAATQLAMPLQSGDRHDDGAAELAFDFSLPRPIEQTAEPSAAGPPAAITTTTETKTAATEEAPRSQPRIAEARPDKIVAAVAREPAPARAAAAVNIIPVGRSIPDMRGKPFLPQARRSIAHAPPAITRDEPHRIERPVRRLSAATIAKPKRAHVAVARTVRAVRFMSAYYAQYAQSAAQSYGYGEGNVQGASPEGQEQIAVRRVARPHGGKVNAAVGGPFVRARNP